MSGSLFIYCGSLAFIFYSLISCFKYKKYLAKNICKNYLKLKTAFLNNITPFHLLLICIAFFSILIVYLPKGIKLLGILFICMLFYSFLQKNVHFKNNCLIETMTIFFYSLYLLFYFHSPLFWYLLRQYTRGVSTIISMVTFNTVSIGYNYSGLSIFILFCLYYLCYFLFTDHKNIFRLILVIILLKTIFIIYMICMSFIMRFSLLQPYKSIHFNSFYNYKLYLLLIYLLFVFFHDRFFSHKTTAAFNNVQRQGKTSMFFVTIVLFTAATFMIVFPEGQGIQKNKIALYSNGSFDWEKPKKGLYGLDKIGMFGLLPVFLNSQDFPLEKINQITSKSLESVQTLLLINLNHDLSETEKNTIYRFVEQGGSLMVLGDHTGNDVIRIPYNNLLKKVHIAFNFDSAIPFADNWHNAYQLFPHPVLNNVKEKELKFGIGASLRITYPAYPLVAGKYGFSDKGNIKNRNAGYLGDMQFSFDEMLGDLVIAAGSRYGRGKILVFGDTSPFQNGSLFHSSRFIINIFTWLSSPHQGVLIDVLKYSGYFLIFIIIFFIFLKHHYFNILLLTLLPAIILITSTFTPSFSMTWRTRINLSRLKIAYIDSSHMEDINYNIRAANNVDGLAINLMRNDIFPVFVQKFPDLEHNNIKILILLAPKKSFNKTEQKNIHRFMQKGGIVIIALNNKDYRAVKSLLEDYKINILNMPLGRISPEGSDFKVILNDTWPVAALEDNSIHILLKAWGLPVLVYKEIENGGMMIIGDSSFFHNDYFEGIYKYNGNNIRYFNDFLKNYVK